MHSSWVRWYFEVVRKDNYTVLWRQVFLFSHCHLSPGFLIKAAWTAEELHYYVRQIKIPEALDWMA